jgi:hypothetical protein
VTLLVAKKLLLHRRPQEGHDHRQRHPAAVDAALVFAGFPQFAFQDLARPVTLTLHRRKEGMVSRKRRRMKRLGIRQHSGSRLSDRAMFGAGLRGRPDRRGK